jgi:hypothetical protein
MEPCRCEMRGNCGFMRQYDDRLRELTHFYGVLYCTGMKMRECKRLEYQLLHGVPPSDGMMPNGMVVPEVVTKRLSNRGLSSSPFPEIAIRVAS